MIASSIYRNGFEIITIVYFNWMVFFGFNPIETDMKWIWLGRSKYTENITTVRHNTVVNQMCNCNKCLSSLKDTVKSSSCVWLCCKVWVNSLLSSGHARHFKYSDNTLARATWLKKNIFLFVVRLMRTLTGHYWKSIAHNWWDWLFQTRLWSRAWARVDTFNLNDS